MMIFYLIPVEPQQQGKKGEDKIGKEKKEKKGENRKVVAFFRETLGWL